MKLRCVERASGDNSFTYGKHYVVDGETSVCYHIAGDDGCTWAIEKSNLAFCGQPEIARFEIVQESVNNQRVQEPKVNQTESVQIATLRSIQEQCSRANLSISIDPEGFNIFDCDTDMQTMVHSVAEVVEILETKLEYKDSMGKWGWL